MSKEDIFSKIELNTILQIYETCVPDQVRTLSQVGTSSYMAYAMWELTQGVPIWLKKFLLGTIVNCIVHAVFTFHIYFSSCTCIRVRIRFRYQRCDVCVDLHMIYNYVLRMTVLERIRRWFYCVFFFIRGKDKRSEGGQSIIGDIPIRSSP